MSLWDIDDEEEIEQVKPKLCYIQELLSINDIKVRKDKAKQICSKKAVLDTKYGFFRYLKRDGTPSTTIGGNTVYCVFGFFYDNWNKFYEREKAKNYNYGGKNGIEILGSKPNATGSTYSNKCRITVNDLKNACKMNGIKPVGDKKRLLHLLMKI